MFDFFRYLKIAFKKFLPRRILWRTLFILILPIILLQIIIGIVFYRQYIDERISETVNRTASEIAFIRDHLHDYQDVDIFLKQISLVFDAHYQTIPKNNIFLKNCDSSYIIDWVKEKLKRYEPNLTICDTKQKRVYVFIVPLLADKDLRILINQKYFLSAKWHFLPVWSIGSSLLFIIIAILFLKNQIRPITKLGKAAEAFGRGQTDYHFRPAGAIEIRSAGEAFLKMKENIRTHIESRTLLLAGVSHDLRTILTRFALEISLMEQSEATLALKDDIKRMQVILEAYLNFVSHEHREELKPLCPVSLIETIMGRFTRQDKIITFYHDTIPECLLREGAFTRCIINLLSNALRYADKIHISLTYNEHHIILTLEDNGQGVPETAYEEIFKPFVTFDFARTQNNTSTIGLGLSVTRDIAQANGGQVRAGKSLSLGGLKMILTFAYIPLNGLYEA